MSSRTDIFLKCEAADTEVRDGPHAWIQWKGTFVCMAHELGFADQLEARQLGKRWSLPSRTTHAGGTYVHEKPALKGSER